MTLKNKKITWHIFCMTLHLYAMPEWLLILKMSPPEQRDGINLISLFYLNESLLFYFLSHFHTFHCFILFPSCYLSMYYTVSYIQHAVDIERFFKNFCWSQWTVIKKTIHLMHKLFLVLDYNKLNSLVTVVSYSNLQLSVNPCIKYTVPY